MQVRELHLASTRVVAVGQSSLPPAAELSSVVAICKQKGGELSTNNNWERCRSSAVFLGGTGSRIMQNKGVALLSQLVLRTSLHSSTEMVPEGGDSDG